MKIIVKAPLMGDRIIETLAGNKFEDLSYTFIEKKAMELHFVIEGEVSIEEAINLTKKIIKETEFGKGIYFSVVAG